MNKADLIEKVAGQANISKSAAGDAVNALLDSIADSLKRGDSVTLIGFGTFAVSPSLYTATESPILKN